MSISIYDASIPQFVRMLHNLEVILEKGEAHATANGMEAASLIEGRLAPDMFALARQVQIATDGVKACGARLAGVEAPSFPDTETTFAELQERLAKTIRFLESLPAPAFEGAETRIITFKLRGEQASFSGLDYLFRFVIPNFYFHVTTAYDILRHNGVALGKRNFLGEI